MDVRLLFHTPEPERAIAAAARLCYAPVGAAELLETMGDDGVHRVLKTIISSGHTSALEHASYTFAIDGVSRALTHQLVRHRLASYNQQSQRYVSYAEEPTFIVPPSVASDPEALKRFKAANASAFAEYRGLIEAGIPAEDARYLLPNAMETKIVVTMNASCFTSSSCAVAIARSGRSASWHWRCSNSPSRPRPTSSWTLERRAAAALVAKAR